MRELVTLRKRMLSSGVESLYLDYMVNGKRVRENLKMYILPGSDRMTRYQNAETMRIAMAEKAKRTMQIESRKAGLAFSHIRATEYLADIQREYEESGRLSYASSVRNARLQWEKCHGNQIYLSDITKDDVTEFIAFLRRVVSPGTVSNYYQTLKTCLNTAVRRGFISASPLQSMERSEVPKIPETKREYLTIGELKALSGTECRGHLIKEAFMFSCFTGLRRGDIYRLDWSQIRPGADGKEIVDIQMQKTRSRICLPLSANALAWLPKVSRREGPVFNGLSKPGDLNYQLAKWVKRAGIRKAITFHCARHTFATLSLAYGADIYTVSKLLGHSNVAVTQVYAKVVDERKRAAVNLIPEL